MKLLPSLATLGIASIALVATTFSGGLQPATARPASCATAAGWEEIGQLPRPLESHGMVTLGDFVYVLGGWNDERGPYAEAYVAALAADGTLANWRPTTAPMPLRLQHHATIVDGNALWVIGGDNGFWQNSRVSARIFRAVPEADGDITAWVEVGQLPDPRTVHAAITLTDRLYILGGTRTFRPGTTVLDTIFTTTISPDGQLGEFQTLAPFPTPTSWLTATAIDRHLFAIAGRDRFSPGFSPAGLSATVWAATADGEGRLSAFEAIGTTAARARHTTVRWGRALVLIGGRGASGALASVECAEVDARGQLSEWTELDSLPEARFAHAAFANDRGIYVSGGFLQVGDTATSQAIFRLAPPVLE